MLNKLFRLFALQYPPFFSKFYQPDGVATPYRTIGFFFFRRLIKKASTSGALSESIWFEIQVSDYLDQGQVN
jgi:hypothetical protein